MSNDTASRLAALEAMVQAEQKKLKRSLTITVIVYVLVIVAVLAYTLIIGQMIVTRTQPEAVARQLGDLTKESLPTVSAELVTYLKENAEPMAVKTVAALREQVPLIEAPLTEMLDNYTTLLADHLQREAVPAFVEFIKKDTGEAKLDYAALNDEEVALGLAELFVESIDNELGQYLNEHANVSLGKLATDIEALIEVDDATMTNHQEAQRRFAVCWAQLSHISSDETSALQPLFEQLTKRYGLLGAEVEADFTPATNSSDDHLIIP